MKALFVIGVVTCTVFAAMGAEKATNSDNAIAYEYAVFIGVPAPVVWDAISKPEIIGKYHMVPVLAMDFKAGGKVEYGLEDRVVIRGKFVEIIRQRKLVHSFSFAHQPNEPESTVTYLLEPLDAMTKLTVLHDGFPSENETYADIQGGWPVILNELKTLLETGKGLPWPGKATNKE